MSERSKRIEECARALLDGSEGVKLNAGTAEVMNYWNRYRGLRADLRAALAMVEAPSVPTEDAPDDGSYEYAYTESLRILGEALGGLPEADADLPMPRMARRAAAAIVRLRAIAPSDEYRRGVEEALREVEARVKSWPTYTDAHLALASVARCISALLRTARPPKEKP